MGRLADAELLVNRALQILERPDFDPDLKQKCYRLQASLSWDTNRRSEAVAALRQALDLAEQLRSKSSGSEHQRATFFGSFASFYERMVDWQTELADPAEVLEAMERCRCRVLVDQMAAQGVDLLAGVPAEEADKLREAERICAAARGGAEEAAPEP